MPVDVNQRKGQGTDETERPPVFSVVGRVAGTVCYFVRQRAEAKTGLEVVHSSVPQDATILYTDEWGAYARIAEQLKTKHATVRQGRQGDGSREWDRDDEGDGIREVHCNSCAGHRLTHVQP